MSSQASILSHAHESLVLQSHLATYYRAFEEIQSDPMKKSIDVLRLIESICDKILKLHHLETGLKDRVSYIASRLLPLAQARKIDLIDHEIVQMKFAMQQENILFNSLNDTGAFDVIDHIIDLNYVLKVINSLSCEEIKVEDLGYFFSLFLPRFSFVESCLLVPKGYFPTKESLQKAITSYHDDPLAQIVGDLVLAYFEENEDEIVHELPCSFLADRTDFILDLLKTFNNKDFADMGVERREAEIELLRKSKLVGKAFKLGTEEIATKFASFERLRPMYSLEKRFVPLSFFLQKYIQSALRFPSTAHDVGDMLDTPSVLKINPVFESSELEAVFLLQKASYEIPSIEVFELLCRIQTAVLSKMTAVPPISCDLNYHRFHLLVLSKVEQKGLSDIYPLNMEKFLCDSALEFIRLPLHLTRASYAHQLSLRHERANIEAEVLKKETVEPTVFNFADFFSQDEKPLIKKAKKPEVKKPVIVPVAVHQEVQEHVVAKPEAVEIAEIKPNPLYLSLKSTKQCLPKLFKLHPRIQAWFDSVDQGLMFYRFDPKVAAMTEAEFIRRKRLPPDLLVFLFDEHFSNPSVWIHKKKQFKRRTCDVFIDGGLYRIQATINEKNRLYHFSAYPLSLKKEEEQRLSEEAIEALDLDELDAAHLWEMPGIKGLAFDHTGNAHLDFEGRHYEIILRR